MADSIQIDVATTTQNVEIQVTEPPADSFFIEYIYPQGPAGVNTWGSLLGTLTAQTDLWNVLSAKALNADLIDLSGNVIDFEAFINSVSGSWNGGQEALTVLAGNSALWDFGYDVATYVQANSAFWEESSEIIPTVTNYLSTNIVEISALTITNTLPDINSLTVTGNISASGTLYGRAQDLSLDSTSTNTVTNSAITAALQLLVPAPTYITPTASLTNFSTPTVEVGTTISQTLNLNWVQYDAGVLLGAALRKNGNIIQTYPTLPQTYNVSEIATLATTTYQLSVSYDTGLIKNNILGFADPRGQILAGSVQSASRSYTGYYRRWIGSYPTFLSDPNQVRTIGLTTSLDNNNTLASTSSPVYIDNKFILIAIPDTKVLTNVVTEVNETLTTQFNLSSVQIKDAGGVDRAYKLYYLETALPLNLNLTNVTIANV